MGIYGCGSCLCACFMMCVVVGRSFLRAVLPLWRPSSQHTCFPHLRMCSSFMHHAAKPIHAMVHCNSRCN